MLVRIALSNRLSSGMGAMTEWTDIVQLVVDQYDLKEKPLS